jgi:hypothetical protein
MDRGVQLTSVLCVIFYSSFSSLPCRVQALIFCAMLLLNGRRAKAI